MAEEHLDQQLEQQLENLEVYSSDSDFSDSDDEFIPQRTTHTGNSANSNNTNNDKSVTTNSIKDKDQILSKFSDKITTDELNFKKKRVNKDKADRATVENVLDPRTINFIISLMRKTVFTKINGCLSTGKEANVYHAEHEDTGAEYAVKVYKTSILVFKDRERYVDGEFRFRNARSQHNPRKMIKVWAEKEFRNLKRLYNSGMNSPEPIALKSHVLVMEFLSNGDGFPSPKLKDHPFESAEEVKHFYHEMIYAIRFMYQKCRLVHADLSEYNSIVHQGQLYIFDVSQSVEPEHPMSLDFLRMDIKNVNDFFSRMGIQVINERHIFKFTIEPQATLGFERDDKEEWLEYIEQLPLKNSDDPEEIKKDEVFRSLHLMKSLNGLEERDFQKFTDGEIDTINDLTGMKKIQDPRRVEVKNGDEEGNNDKERPDNDDEEADDEEDDDEVNSEDDSEYDSDEESEYEDDEETGERRRKEKPLVGKKYEDRDVKKLRKQQTKEDAREKRKTKVKKHIKKKLIKKRTGGKK